jgi:hypothetical protein
MSETRYITLTPEWRLLWQLEASLPTAAVPRSLPGCTSSAADPVTDSTIDPINMHSNMHYLGKGTLLHV